MGPLFAAGRAGCVARLRPLPARSKALATAGAAIVAVMIAGQAHVSYRFTYTEGDVAIDMLMYSQASPDVERVMDDLGEFSRQMTGDRDITVMYDSGFPSWPFQWYLRDYPNRRFYGLPTIDSPERRGHSDLAGHLAGQPRHAVWIHLSGLHDALVLPGEPDLPALRYRPRAQR
ncbi:MAG: hypothetical protein R3A46_06695 [Thermomicrobiales bacterium]